MNLLKYRNYYGSIEVSAEDNCFFGKLLFINPLVNYEGETVNELTQAFEQAVDDYLADCEAMGYKPEIPYKDLLNINLGQELYTAASNLAARENISLNDLAKRAISNYIH